MSELSGIAVSFANTQQNPVSDRSIGIYTAMFEQTQQTPSQTRVQSETALCTRFAIEDFASLIGE